MAPLEMVPEGLKSSQERRRRCACCRPCPEASLVSHDTPPRTVAAAPNTWTPGAAGGSAATAAGPASNQPEQRLTARAQEARPQKPPQPRRRERVASLPPLWVQGQTLASQVAVWPRQRRRRQVVRGPCRRGSKRRTGLPGQSACRKRHCKTLTGEGGVGHTAAVGMYCPSLAQWTS